MTLVLDQLCLHTLPSKFRVISSVRKLNRLWIYSFTSLSNNFQNLINYSAYVRVLHKLLILITISQNLDFKSIDCLQLVRRDSCRLDSLGLQHSAPSSTTTCLDQRAHFGRKGGINAINFLLLDSIRRVKEPLTLPMMFKPNWGLHQPLHWPIKALVRARERPEHVKLAKSN